MKNHNRGPLGLFFFKFQNFGKNPENRAGSGPGFPISGPGSGLHRDPEIVKNGHFRDQNRRDIPISGSRLRDPIYPIVHIRAKQGRAEQGIQKVKYLFLVSRDLARRGGGPEGRAYQKQGRVLQGCALGQMGSGFFFRDRKNGIGILISGSRNPENRDFFFGIPIFRDWDFLIFFCCKN